MAQVEELKISMDDTYMNVIRFGSGAKNMVMIAGISLTGLEGQGAGVAAAYAEWADKYTVYLFDRKKVLPQGYQVRDMANDVYRALQELGVERACVYGVSQGGMIGQWLTLDHPELVERLVVCSSQCRPTEKMRSAVGTWLDLARRKDVVGLNRSFFQLVYSPKFLDGVRDALPTLEKVGTPADCERFEVLAEACVSFDVHNELHRITCPVVAICDKNDQVIGPEGCREIAEILGCKLVEYDQYSHAVYDECAEVKSIVG